MPSQHPPNPLDIRLPPDTSNVVETCQNPANTSNTFLAMYAHPLLCPNANKTNTQESPTATVIPEITIAAFAVEANEMPAPLRYGEETVAFDISLPCPTIAACLVTFG